MIAGFDKTPMNSWGSEWTFLGLERNFEWSKTAWIFHPHRVTSYFWWVHNPSQISPREIHEFLRTNKLNDVSKVEIGDLNIADSTQIGHLVAGMPHCVLFFSLTGRCEQFTTTQLAGTAVSGVQVFLGLVWSFFFRSFWAENNCILLLE